MSHFSVAVFSRTPGDVETLLAPFNEQVAPGDPYAYSSGMKAASLTGKDRQRATGTTPTPVGLVGDRRALARPASTASGQKRLYRAVGTLAQGFRLSAPSLRAALVADCDFSPNEAQIRRAARMWEVCVEGGEPREGEDLLKLWEPSTTWSATATRRPLSAGRQHSTPTPSSRQGANGMSRAEWAGLGWTTRPMRVQTDMKQSSGHTAGSA